MIKIKKVKILIRQAYEQPDWTDIPYHTTDVLWYEHNRKATPINFKTNSRNLKIAEEYQKKNFQKPFFEGGLMACNLFRPYRLIALLAAVGNTLADVTLINQAIPCKSVLFLKVSFSSFCSLTTRQHSHLYAAIQDYASYAPLSFAFVPYFRL